MHENRDHQGAVQAVHQQRRGGPPEANTLTDWDMGGVGELAQVGPKVTHEASPATIWEVPLVTRDAEIPKYDVETLPV